MINKDRISNARSLGSDALNKVSNKAFFLLLVFSVALQLFRYIGYAVHPRVEEWNTQELTMSYRYGFIRRGLLGTITYFIYDVLHLDFLQAVSIVQNIGLILFTAAFLIFFWRLLKNGQDKSFCFITLVLISLNVWGFHFKFYGLLESYMVFLTFLMVYMILTGKAMFLIPILAGLCVMIHEAYPMMFFGVIVSLIIYKFCYEDNSKMKTRYALVFIVTSIVIGGLFIYLYILHPRIENADPELILENCRKLLKVDELNATSMRIIWFDNKQALTGENSDTIMWNGTTPTIWFLMFILTPVINCIVLSPLIIMRIKFWKKIIKNESDKTRRILLTLSSLMVLLVLPLLIVHTDQGRWFYTVVISEIILVGALSLMNKNNERSVLSEITKLTLPKVLLAAFYCFFYFDTDIFFSSNALKAIVALFF